MEEKEITPNESLRIIDSMINSAKNRLADDGFLLIFWGWLVFVSALLSYAFIVGEVDYAKYVWAILMPSGAIVSIIYGLKKRKTNKVRTSIDSCLGYAWTSFIIALFITMAFMQVHGFRHTYFFLMILYGMATFTSGGILNFKPLVYGSVFSFLFAIVSVFSDGKELLLCLAGAIFFSYIIPGHLLRSRFKSQNV